MIFNSLEFIVFFVIVLFTYFYLPHKYRWAFLLLGSCYFYTVFIPAYLLILFLLITIDYTAGIFIERSHSHRHRKLFLIISIVSTCLVLFVFKYFNFANQNLEKLAQFIGWNYPVKHLSLILPIGLSFHTFQSLSYVIEVYRKNQKAEYNFGIYAVYVMFFPQLVAGPIERPQNLLHQFYEKHDFDYNRVTDGLKLMAWGFFKKIMIADRFGNILGQIFNAPYDYAGPAILMAAVLFAYQIYCDFSGYTDIARGSAQVLGFRLMENFRAPYQAASVQDFWRRWHISLSTWFRDYVYFPLGGNRVSKQRWYFNILITFFLSGIWHGANWTFIVWGLLHGLYIVGGDLTKETRANVVRLIGLNRMPALHKFIQIVITFGLVTLSWIFFRAENIRTAASMIKRMFLTGWPDILSGMGWHALSVKWGFFKLGVTKKEYIFCVGLVVFLEIINYLQQKMSIRSWIGQQHVAARWGLYYAYAVTLLLLGHYVQSQFIYFQF